MSKHDKEFLGSSLFEGVAMSDIGRRIQALLRRRGENLSSLASRLRVTEHALQKAMAPGGTFSGLISLNRVSAALGVPVTTLTTGNPWPYK